MLQFATVSSADSRRTRLHPEDACFVMAGRPQRKAVSAALCAWEQFGAGPAAKPGACYATRSRTSMQSADDVATGEQQQQQQQAPRLLHAKKRQQREVNAMLAVIGRYKASGRIQVDDPEDQAKVMAALDLAPMLAIA